MRSRVLQKPILSSWDALLDYCHTAMAHREIEQFRVLYLDRKNHLIADEEQARGTVDQATFYKFCNGDISKTVLGQTMTTDDGASLAQGLADRPRAQLVVVLPPRRGSLFG